MRRLIIKKNNTGKRLDKFLAQTFFSQHKIISQLQNTLTRGEIIRNIREGRISINEKKIKPSYILKEKDVVYLDLKPFLQELVPNEKINFEIIFQDNNIIVINKPAGLKVHPNSFAETNTLVNGLLSKFPEIKNVSDSSIGSEFRPGIVHRLDQDTSGTMVVARNQKSFESLKKLFQTKKIVKKYLALVIGKLKNKQDVIEKSIAKSSSYKKQVIAGKKTRTKILEAITQYNVKQEFSNFSLVEAWPKTGRTHQIRIHFFSLGNPVAGDKKYRLKKNIGLILPPRQLLHAQTLDFELFGRKYSLEAKLPQDFSQFLTKLQ